MNFNVIVKENIVYKTAYQKGWFINLENSSKSLTRMTRDPCLAAG